MNLNFNLKMKKILIFVLMSTLVSCKTVKTKCDCYGSTNQELNNEPEFDIHKITKESQSKYVMSTIIR
jgi:hypothetical protein